MGYLNDISAAAKSVNLPFEKFSGCKILVTGATGLIGSCLVKVLMNVPEMDFDVYASGRNEERAKALFGEFWEKERFHFIKIDVMESVNSGITFHYIIHAASYAGPADFQSHPVGIIKTNIIGLSNLLDYGRNNGLRRLLYVSSGEVYGLGDGRVFDESYSGYVDCTSPRSCYPSAKRAAESLCVAYGQEYGIECVIARPCHVYGPEFTERDNRAYAQFIRNARNGNDIVMNSAGSQLRSWCYVVDCASALLHILLLGHPGEAYNVADDNSVVSVRQFAQACADIAGVKMICPDSFNPTDIASRQSVYSVGKLSSLGWAPMTALADGILNSIDYCER